MRDRRPSTMAGFSLVELLVAVTLTAILMAGLAKVFKSSLSTFVTTGEKLSNSRRNNLSLDLLYEDLNSAGMFLSDLNAEPGGLSEQAPPFFIRPNMEIQGLTTDELYFYLDQPLPFEGSLKVGAGLTTVESASSKVFQTLANPSQSLGDQDRTYTIDCGHPTYAAMVQPGHGFIRKDNFEVLNIERVLSVSGNQVKVLTGASPAVAITGLGASDAPTKVQPIPDSGVLFFAPRQMVRYRREFRKLDPMSSQATTPCLVRDQGTYSPATDSFTPTGPQQVIAENVLTFKVFLSVDSGATWAGEGKTYKGLDAGWHKGIRKELDDKLATVGRDGFKTTVESRIWFRDIPTLVRVDVTTRTATARGEYDTRGQGATHAEVTQSLILMPRHFGLPIT